MLEEKQIKKIIELKEKGLTVKDIAKTVNVSESTVKKYTSDDYEHDNEIDEKSALNITKHMIEEGYTFDEIETLGYSLKLQANEIDITLFDYLTDINSVMGNFLKITNTPERFYYVFMELANNLSGFTTNNIEATDLINAINKFYDREIEMENAEQFIIDIETKAENIVSETKAELTDLNNQILYLQKEHTKLTSLNSIICMKMLEEPNKEKLEIAEENFKNMESELKKLQNINIILIEKCKLLEQNDKYNEIIKQENMVFNMAYDKLYKLFPQECDSIIKELDNEIQ